MPGPQNDISRQYPSPAALSGPGKLAPTLIEDLHIYDPCHPPRLDERQQVSSSTNILRDVPLRCWGFSNIATILPEGSCRHKWWKKERQCDVPSPGSEPHEESRYQFAGICCRCRLHLDLQVNYTEGWLPQPCPNATHLAHHFVHTSPNQDTASRAARLWGATISKDEHATAFQCSAAGCSAAVLVRFQNYQFPEDYLQHLVDGDILSQRAHRAIKADPQNLEGCAVPSPHGVLSSLRSYLENALDGKNLTIRAGNKGFNLRFGWKGLESKEVLEHLGFRLENDTWYPPRVAEEVQLPLKHGDSILLDDISNELKCWMAEISKEGLNGVRHHEASSSRADEDSKEAFELMLQCLNAQDYPKILQPRRQSNDVDYALRDRSYTALGSPENASDELLIFACQRQMRTNKSEASEYLSAMRQVADRRRSDDLFLFIGQELSAGRHDSEQIRAAYQYFTIEDPTLSQPTDGDIIGTFEARLGSDPNHESEMREKLRIIGRHRESSYILSFVEAPASYQQALDFLGATPETSNEAIITLYDQKTNEFPLLSVNSRKAVMVIAGERPENMSLLQWLEGDIPMDIGEAYQALGISDRTIDTAIVESVFNVACEDDSMQSEKYSKAFQTILAHREHDPPRSFSPQWERGLSDWPVGLENIGNTCYLNSLLQFLFTIPQLRNLVLNFEEVKMDPTPENLASKQVGSRRIPLREVLQAQKFVRKLRELLQTMISSPYKYVTPDQDFTRLTLMTSTVRRRSTIGGSRPLGPLGTITQDSEAKATDDNAISMDIDPPPLTGPPPPETNESQGDNSSDVTLVSPPSVQGVEISEGSPEPAENEQNKTQKEEDISATGKQVDTSMSNGNQTEPPSRPPPIPPRPLPAVQTTPSLEEYARQQDVTEVLNHVLFQLSCAIKPRGVDEDGEQIDQIKDLFYGQTKQHTMAENRDAARLDRFCSIIVRIFDEPPNIYAALDGYFDLEQVGQKKRYLSISRPPPIFQIQIDRVGTDQRKNNHHIEIFETIYLDRYLEEDTNPALMARREKAWEWKRDKAELQKEHEELNDGLSPETNVAMLLENAYKQLIQLQNRGVEVSETLENDLRILQEQARTCLEGLDAECELLSTKLKSQFADTAFQRHAYRLHAAFFHRGTATSGHYWIYIYDFTKELWLKYNDTLVQEVTDTNEIFRRPSDADFAQWNGPANPYYLVYVRDQDKDQLVQSVCRSIEEAPEQKPESSWGPGPAYQDTDMTTEADQDDNVAVDSAMVGIDELGSSLTLQEPEPIGPRTWDDREAGGPSRGLAW